MAEFTIKCPVIVCTQTAHETKSHGIKCIKGELTKNFLFLFSLDQVSLISLLKYFPPKMSLT